MIDLSPDLPPAPDVAGATREAIETEFELLGPRLEKELEFRPQFAQAEIETLLQFAPQFADIQQQLARRERGLQEELFPEEVGVERALGRTLEEQLAAFERPTADIPADLEAALSERFRAEEASAGRFGSPVGSLNLAKNLGFAGEELRRQRVAEQAQTLAQAAGFTGRVPFVSGAQTPVPRPVAAGPTLTGGLTGQQLGLTGSIFGTQTQGAIGQAGFGGDILGGAIGGLGSFFGGRGGSSATNVFI